MVAVVFVAGNVGRRIGTNADFTSALSTSMCSLSESSDDERDEWSFVEFRSIEELIL